MANEQALMQIADRLGGIEANQVSLGRSIDEVRGTAEQTNDRVVGTDGQPGLCMRMDRMERWSNHITKKLYWQARWSWAIVGVIVAGVAVKIIWSWYSGGS